MSKRKGKNVLMGHTLILAEKPSQAKAYADALQHTKKQDGYIEVNDGRFFKEKAYITWGYGHLVELLSPEQYNETWKVWRLDQLPMFPDQFRFQVSKDKKKQFNIVKRLLNDPAEIIVATDCDREGENIARSIISLAGASHKPTKRLWINSLEVDEIQKGFRHLNNGNNYLSFHKYANASNIPIFYRKNFPYETFIDTKSAGEVVSTLFRFSNLILLVNASLLIYFIKKYIDVWGIPFVRKK